MISEQEQIENFVEHFCDPLRPFPFPKNWLDLCSLCKLKAVSAIAQAHGEVAELYNNARPSNSLNDFPMSMRMPFFKRSERDCSWLGIQLRSKNNKKPYFICALDTVPLVCECKEMRCQPDLSGAEKDAILARAKPEKLKPGDGARL